MLESKEKTIIGGFKKDNFFGEWVVPKNENTYENIFNSFFGEGRPYAGDNLIFKGVTASDAAYIINDGPTKNSLGYIGEKNPTNRIYKISIELTAFEDRDEFRYRTKNNGDDIDIFQVVFNTLIDPTITVYNDNVQIEMTASSFDGKKLDITFTLTNSSLASDMYDYSDFIHTVGGYVTFSQYEVIAGTDLLSGPMDCSDFASFLWAAKKGKLIKTKLFTCDSLIDETFEYVEFTKKIYANNKFIEYDDLDDVLADSKLGDILVFVQNDIKHCLVILNPSNRSYAESSSFVTYNLGNYYNCKQGSYDMINRVKDLSKNSIVYLTRLL